MNNNMTTNEAVRIVAEYDGWLIVPEGTYIECHSQTTWYGHGGKFDCYHDVTAESDMPYLTNLNELHRVALGVMERLGAIYFDTEKEYANQPLFVDGIANQESLRAKRIDKIERINNNILFCFRSKPVNSQYIDLLLAVARGIEFINGNKKDIQ